MKKVGKLLIGVLSVGALIGTGYAAWTVNGGYVSNDGEIPFEIATIGSKEMSLEVTEKDTSEKVVFDAPKEWHGNEHLTKTYNVKAIKGVDLVDTPYVCASNGYWDLVSKPYQPHLKISTVAIDKETKEALTGSRLTTLESYITLPKDEVVDYKTWLKSELETTGFDYTFTFSWTSGVNPQIAWKDLAEDVQAKNFTDLNKAFEGVAFKYTIQVGGVNEDTPVPGETYTGEVTIPTIPSASLTVEGLVDGKLTTGKHAITLTLDEGKVLKDDTLYINSDEVVMTKVDLTVKLTSGKGYTYTCNYDFKEGINYTFNYAVENEVTPIKKTSFTYTENDLVAIDFTLEDMTKVMPGELLDVGTEVYFDLLVEDGYTYETYFNGTLLEDISFILAEGTNNFEVKLTKEEPPVKAYKVNVTGEHITFNYSTDITKELPLGTEVTFTYTVEEGYELKSLTFNGVDVKDTKKFTVVADKNELVATTELIPVAKKAKVIVDATLTGAEIAITGETEDKMYELGTTITLTASGSVGYELQELYYTVEGSETKVAITDNTFTVTEEKTYTIGYTVLDLSNPIKATIAEVIADTTYDQTHLYEVTGTVTSIERAEYGRFSMTDDSGKTIKIYGSRIENAENKSLSYVNGKYDYDYNKGDDPTPAMQVGYKVTVLAFGKKSSSYNDYYGVISSYEVVAIAPTSIVINETDKTLEVGKSITISDVTVDPNNYNVKLSWKSENEEIASIVDGKITANAVGETYVYAYYNDVLSNKVKVTVTEPTATTGYTLIKKLDFIQESQGSSIQMKNTEIVELFNSKLESSGIKADTCTILSSDGKAFYSAKGTGGPSVFGPRFGKNKQEISLKFVNEDGSELINKITKVVINYACWSAKEGGIKVNGVDSDITTKSMEAVSYTFEITATDTIAIQSTGRNILQFIEFYYSK